MITADQIKISRRPNFPVPGFETLRASIALSEESMIDLKLLRDESAVARVRQAAQEVAVYRLWNRLYDRELLGLVRDLEVMVIRARGFEQLSEFREIVDQVGKIRERLSVPKIEETSAKTGGAAAGDDSR